MNARNDLFRAVEDQLRVIAERSMRRERPDHTLQAAVLIDDAFMQLLEYGQHQNWESRTQFYRAAAHAMRRLLVDHERRRRAKKRGGDYQRVQVDVEQLGVDSPRLDLLALDEALTTLQTLDPRQSEIVELHHFGGRTMEETARIVGLSASMVKKEWAAAKAWLYRELQRGEHRA